MVNIIGFLVINFTAYTYVKTCIIDNYYKYSESRNYEMINDKEELINYSTENWNKFRNNTLIFLISTGFCLTGFYRKNKYLFRMSYLSNNLINTRNEIKQNNEKYMKMISEIKNITDIKEVKKKLETQKNIDDGELHNLEFILPINDINDNRSEYDKLKSKLKNQEEEYINESINIINRYKNNSIMKI